MKIQKIIDGARPMLEELLPKIGLVSPDTSLNVADCLESFSDWVSKQQVPAEDQPFFASLIGSFIQVYLVEHQAGVVTAKDGRINVALPIQDGVAREFDPYAVAQGIAADPKKDLLTFLHKVSA